MCEDAAAAVWSIRAAAPLYWKIHMRRRQKGVSQGKAVIVRKFHKKGCMILRSGVRGKLLKILRTSSMNGSKNCVRAGPSLVDPRDCRSAAALRPASSRPAAQSENESLKNQLPMLFEAEILM